MHHKECSNQVRLRWWSQVIISTGTDLEKFGQRYTFTLDPHGAAEHVAEKSGRMIIGTLVATCQSIHRAVFRRGDDLSSMQAGGFPSRVNLCEMLRVAPRKFSNSR